MPKFKGGENCKYMIVTCLIYLLLLQTSQIIDWFLELSKVENTSTVALNGLNTIAQYQKKDLTTFKFNFNDHFANIGRMIKQSKFKMNISWLNVLIKIWKPKKLDILNQVFINLEEAVVSFKFSPEKTLIYDILEKCLERDKYDNLLIDPKEAYPVLNDICQDSVTIEKLKEIYCSTTEMNLAFKIDWAWLLFAKATISKDKEKKEGLAWMA